MRPKAGRLLLLLLISLAMAGHALGEGAASTAQERAKAIKLVRQLEAEPVGKKAREARQWLALWVVRVADFNFQFCPEILGGTLTARQRVRSEVLAQTTYSSLAWLLENPHRPAVPLDIHRAGVLGALRTYEILRTREPGTISPLLEELVAKRNAGDLDAYLAETVKSCPAAR
jgi:hypothetical protein